ncbi:hypothetical protein ACVRXQ_02785 [Streptococcus panodentis]|uniref:Lipoprotein n=1 Tax=Streptococcus panodentis TaxID=1581472 RepID=A0ABS5AZ39_9STRE|nr:hypothetical protein [Streptococcus panodentis]MBP2621785.1 hypothetical protein [Streptococcus panodentis]
MLLLTVLLSGCGILGNQSNKVDREKLEKDLDFLSEVYPTEKVSDLFEKFPKGFEIYYSVAEPSDAHYFSYKLDLKGDSTNQEITGSYKKVDYVPETPETLEEMPVRYVEGQGIVALDGSPINPTLSKVEFLFTKLTLNRQVISKLELRNYFENPVSGDERLDYNFTNKWIANYLGVSDNTKIELSIDFLHPSKTYASKTIVRASKFDIYETIYGVIHEDNEN